MNTNLKCDYCDEEIYADDSGEYFYHEYRHMKENINHYMVKTLQSNIFCSATCLYDFVSFEGEAD
jgi:hypothetical protein